MSDTDKILIGNGELSFIIGQATVPALETEYDAAGVAQFVCRDVGFLLEQEVKKHHGIYKGIRILDDIAITQIEMGYKLTLEEVTKQALQMMMLDDGTTADEGSSPDYEKLVPFSSGLALDGFARLRIWDERDQVNPRLMHKDFKAKLILDGSPELGDDWFTFQANLFVLSPVGTFFSRIDA